MKINHLIYKLSLLILFIYAVLRACFVTPLFDEAATFLHYIIPGNAWNPGEFADANNHLLISLFGSFCLELGFDHPFFMRIPSLIGFLVYGLALHILFVKQLKIPFARLVVICLYSIPWVLEYGALARGYGFSIGCYLMLIVLLIEMIKEVKISHMILFFSLSWLTILSSFTFTVPVFLLLGVSFIYFITSIKQQSIAHLILYFLIGCAFLVAYYPLFERALLLKENGSLWWGSSSGLWQVTGKSISNVVFFYSHWSIRILLNVIALTAGVLWFKKLLNTKPSEWFSTTFLWLIAYIFGLIIALIMLAKIFDMNYPMDRVGMYFVPLFAILFVFITSEIKHLNWTGLLLLFFPITFAFNANFNYTIFSPEDLLTDETFEKIEELTKESQQLSAEWILYINHIYKSRSKEHKHVIALASSNQQTDYFINYATNSKSKVSGYDLVFLEKKTGVGLYKKKQLQPKTLFKKVSINTNTFHEAMHYFYLSDSLSQWAKKPFVLKVEGEIEMPASIQPLKLHAEAIDSNGIVTVLTHTNLHQLYYPNKNLKFTSFSLTFPPQELKDLMIRIENPLEKEVTIRNFKVSMWNETN